MKKSFLDRVQAIESRARKRHLNAPITYFDEELNMAMHIIGNGLAVPVPMTTEEWEKSCMEYQKQWQQLSND